jgi:hypothetical protein
VTVHVDELHTEVTPAGEPAGTAAREPAPAPLDAAAEAWRERRRSAAMIARRTAAEGFDD